MEIFSLCLSIKFPHQEIRWNYGIFTMACSLKSSFESNISPSCLWMKLDTFNGNIIHQKQRMISLIYFQLKNDKFHLSSSFSLFCMIRIKITSPSLNKRWSFPLRNSSLNVTKSAGNFIGNCGFSHIYWRNT